MEPTQKSPHIRLGQRGEEIAAGFLQQKGFTILEKNWRKDHKELDLVAVDGDELVAVEVKTRTQPIFEDPAKAINRKKQQNLIQATHAYVRINRITLDVRFDIIWIQVFEQGKYTLTHIPNAFIPLI